MDLTHSRRQFLTTTLAGVTVGLAGCGNPANPDFGPTATGSFPESLGLETVTDDIKTPIAIEFAPDSDGDRRYIADRNGLVYVHESSGLRSEPLLDIRETVVLGGERGLLGIALHPDFQQTRRLFVRYSAQQREGTPDNYSHTFVLSEFTVSDDGRRAQRDSEQTLLTIPEPQSNHNAGDIAFGPDGYLYIPVGDGGGGGDQGLGHVDDWYDDNPGGNGQNVTENLLGSVLRIDVDNRANGMPYAIPDDNPLVGRAGLDEYYAWGLRNPWRLSFDDTDLFVADVGQGDYEEVNLVENGGNYGWNVLEGTHCYNAANCPSKTPDSVRGGEPLIDPIIEYPHSGGGVSGISVIGGYVYRGSTLSGMDGVYVFGDLQANGQVFVATRPDGDGQWPTRAIDVIDEDSNKLQRIFSFGRDNDGEVYVIGSGQTGSGVYQLVSG